MKRNVDKVKDHCPLTGKYGGPDDQKGKTIVTQKQSYLLSFAFNNFSKYACHLFFKRLLDKENDKEIFDVLSKTNAEDISVTYGCIRFIDRSQISSMDLDELVKTLDDDVFDILQNEFSDKREYPIKQLAYPYEFFKSIDDYQKSAKNSKKEDFFTKLKNACPGYEK